MHVWILEFLFYSSGPIVVPFTLAGDANKHLEVDSYGIYLLTKPAVHCFLKLLQAVKSHWGWLSEVPSEV